jgi:hypothetical protein
MHALRRQRRRKGDQGQLRRHPRYACRLRVKALFRQIAGFEILDSTLSVWIQNVSLGGLSFVCERFVHNDTLVYTRFESLPHRPVMKSIVRHCTHLEGRRHEVGCQFTPLAADEEIPAFDDARK